MRFLNHEANDVAEWRGKSRNTLLKSPSNQMVGFLAQKSSLSRAVIRDFASPEQLFLGWTTMTTRENVLPNKSVLCSSIIRSLFRSLLCVWICNSTKQSSLSLSLALRVLWRGDSS